MLVDFKNNSNSKASGKETFNRIKRQPTQWETITIVQTSRCFLNVQITQEIRKQRSEESLFK
jgi:hypothetical protein